MKLPTLQTLRKGFHTHRGLVRPPASLKHPFSGAKSHSLEVRCDVARSRLLSRGPKIGHDDDSAENVWREFFSDPSQWWDHTIYKGSPNYPDFTHKRTGFALWIDKRSNPSWVNTALTSMAPGSTSRSRYSWNTIISQCAKSNQALAALKQFTQMQAEGVKPDAFTFARALNACASLMAVEEGKFIHAQVIESGCEADIFVGNNLLDMYTKCCNIKDAQRVFDKMPARDVVSWTAMIAGYVKCKEGRKALEQFALMQEKDVKPNPVTFVVVLNACASIMALEEGRHVHAQIIESSCESDLFVGNALVDMYAKCGRLEDAQRVFYRMPIRDVVSWTAMIAGYVRCEQGQQALKQFALMQGGGTKPNTVTFGVVLNACGSVMALEEGRCIHAQVIECGCESDIFVGSTLVDMYAKCGSIEDAQRVFRKISTPNMVSWTAMLGAFAMHGRGKEALTLFHEMNHTGVEMDMVTFICILSACSHGGLVEEGIQLFESMGPVYGVSRTVDHYICMVDLLGRAGRLDEAEYLVKSEPKVSGDRAALTALLGACRNQGNVSMGERIARQLLESDPDNADSYVLLSNMYAAVGQWGNCEGSKLAEGKGCGEITWVYLDRGE